MSKEDIIVEIERLCLMRSYLPEEGSKYTHNEKGSAYNRMTGIVYHHDCGTRFMIDTGSSLLCNIKP